MRNTGGGRCFDDRDPLRDFLIRSTFERRGESEDTGGSRERGGEALRVVEVGNSE